MIPAIIIGLLVLILVGLVLGRMTRTLNSTASGINAAADKLIANRRSIRASVWAQIGIGLILAAVLVGVAEFIFG